MFKVKGLEEEDVQIGYVVSHVSSPCTRTQVMECQLMVLDLLDQIPIITSGYEAVMHIHTIVVECRIKALVSELNRKGKVIQER